MPFIHLDCDVSVFEVLVRARARQNLGMQLPFRRSELAAPARIN